MNRYSAPGTCFSIRRLHLILFIIITACVLSGGCYTDRKNSPATIEMAVVFKPDVPVEKASSILYEKEYIFHEGSDNSKGEQYYKQTGPKFIVQVPKDRLETFHLDLKDVPQIYEIYQPDWKNK